MPKLGEGEQVKVWLPTHLLDALRQDAKDCGERHIQSIMRMILGRHYQGQVREAGLDTVEMQGAG